VKLNNTGAALADFERVINEFPQSSAVPMCWQRAAQAVSGKDSTKMVHYYQGLIKCAGRGVKPAAIAEAHYNIARALYEKDPAAAIPHFREARTINPEQYGAAVDLSLVHCYFKLKDADKSFFEVEELSDGRVVIGYKGDEINPKVKNGSAKLDVWLEGNDDTNPNAKPNASVTVSVKVVAFKNK
jgi:tetratricopeptide (TPR) repeat protein